MKRIFAFLFAAAALAGCSDDNGGDGGKDIQLAPGTPKDYTIFADETSGTPSEGISFTTTGPWRASVAETRANASGNGSSSSWVTVSPDHGDAAGDYTIRIELEVNTTGKDRRATVTIECGATKITITVEQKGTTEDGEVPDDGGDEPVVPVGRKLIASMKNTYWYYSGAGIEADGDDVVNFFYDDQLRLTKMVMNTWHETEEPAPGILRKQVPGATAVSSVTTRTRIPVTITAVIAYGDRIASYEITREENGVVDPHNTQTGSVELDEAGRAVSGKYLSYDKDEVPYSDTYELSYDAAGYLVKSVSSEDGEERITWTGGNPTEVWWGSTSDGQDLIDKANYGTVPNKTNLDLNWVFVLATEGWAFASGDSENIFPLIGLTGKRSAHMAEIVTQSNFSGGSDRSYEYAYQTDADGLLTKITQKTSSTYAPEPYKSFETVITYTE